MRENPLSSIGRFARVAALSALAFALAPVGPADAAKAKPSFFGSVEVRSHNLKPFKKWGTALKRYGVEKKSGKMPKCTSKRLKICNYGDWAKFLDSLRDRPKWVQIKAVNARMNKAKYTNDKANWGRKDYWATPGEFMARFGDCEDYAIVKYLSLRNLGFRDKELRVVAVKDLNLKVGHAILVVFYKDEKTGKKRTFVLDNQIKRVVDAKSIRHYKPIFSINRTFWWRHRT